jgi:type IV secretion system protein VirB10
MEEVRTPYEAAEAAEQEAKLMTPEPARKNKKIVVVGLVLAGLILGIVILANVAGMLTGQSSNASGQAAPKPVTLTTQQSKSFAEQQSQQAGFLKGQDRDKAMAQNEDTVLGESNGLADPYAEDPKAPKKTKAQDDAEHGRNAGKSEGQQLRERAALEAQHRRQNDLDSSPVSVDFSDYFERTTAKAATAAPGGSAAIPDSEAAAEEARAAEVARRHQLPLEALARKETPASDDERPSVLIKEPHDPSDDYRFDSAGGRLYRLMEDTTVETVLVNRLAGAAVGPVICMVTTDVYSASGLRLLIPKGTRLLGRVTAVASTNQERLFVAFHRMIMPDGYSVSLDKFQGLDVVGQTGLRDLVNHHYVKIFGASLALAGIAAVTQIGNTGAAYGSYDFGVSMRNGASEQLGQSAQRIMERFLNTLPTFTIRERARVKIMLAGDLLLPDIKNHTMDPDL